MRTLAALRKTVADWRNAGETVALVPTMGALHQGHLALVAEGLKRCDRVVTSIFVNPTQFAPTEDFGSYPRTFDEDRRKLGEAGGDLIWAPTVDVMYGDGDATRIVPAGAALDLETDFRPHFFAGVATVCCKLFNQVRSDVAIFGEKDYQQLAVVTQMVRDLAMPLKIVGYATVREADGLAMSSRNAYLSEAERRIAPVVHRTIVQVAHEIRDGRSIEAATSDATQRLQDAGFRQVDYVAVRDAKTLAVVSDAAAQPVRVLVAAWLGKTRLIDNCPGLAVKRTRNKSK